MKTIKFKYYQILKRLNCRIPKHIVIEYAKSHYLRVSYIIRLGMCDALEYACRYFGIYGTKKIHGNFPEFNPIFCEASNSIKSYDVFWWDVRDEESRIKAFDKLIKYYKEHKKYI